MREFTHKLLRAVRASALFLAIIALPAAVAQAHGGHGGGHHGGGGHHRGGHDGGGHHARAAHHGGHHAGIGRHGGGHHGHAANRGGGHHRLASHRGGHGRMSGAGRHAGIGRLGHHRHGRAAGRAQAAHRMSAGRGIRTGGQGDALRRLRFGLARIREPGARRRRNLYSLAHYRRGGYGNSSFFGYGNGWRHGRLVWVYLPHVGWVRVPLWVARRLAY